MDRVVKITRLVEKDTVRLYKEKQIKKKKMVKELNHTRNVVTISRHLALKRKCSGEIAAVAATLHDVGRVLCGVKGKGHAPKGAEKAGEILQESGKFCPEEIEVITRAISTHNRKGKYGQGIYSELLKDADLLSRYLDDPGQSFGPRKTQRLFRLKRELYEVYDAGKRGKKPAAAPAVILRQGAFISGTNG